MLVPLPRIPFLLPFLWQVDPPEPFPIVPLLNKSPLLPLEPQSLPAYPFLFRQISLFPQSIFEGFLLEHLPTLNSLYCGFWFTHLASPLN